MKNYEVIIIGGGASGTICAITAKNKGKNVAIIDDSEFIAKKLLVTGNGKCNLTNLDCDSKYYNQDISKYISKFSVKDTMVFFENIGLEMHTDAENRVYPVSNYAKSVVTVLQKEIERKNIDVFCNEKVINIEKSKDGFVVMTTKQEYFCQKLVVATGGNTMFEIAKKFNIKTKPISKSLCAIKTSSTKRLDGIRVSDVIVTLKSSNNDIKEKGEILFKDSGLSGIAVLNLSSYLARNIKFEGEISLNLLPSYTKEKLENIIKRNSKIFEGEEVLCGLFHKELAKDILWRNNIKNSNSLSEKNIKDIVKTIQNLTFKIKGCYDNNQVYSGGILLDELTENLESKSQKDMYFCGEICDVDGICGGYNLQWAWSSGHIVGESL